MSHQRCECHECTQARYRLANPISSIQAAMSNNPLMNWNNNPPRCPKHNQPMSLCFWDRPGSPPGNGWRCEPCGLEWTTEGRENVNQANKEYLAQELFAIAALLGVHSIGLGRMSAQRSHEIGQLAKRVTRVRTQLMTGAAHAQTEQAVAEDAAHTEVVDKSRGAAGEPSGERD